jgi:Fe-S-cluster containining protein
VGPNTGSLRSYILGKRGHEILPSEVRKIKRLAHKLRNRVDDHGEPIQYRILPSVGITPEDQESPPTKEQIDTYQIMGRTPEGDICPFLSTIKEGIKTPTGAHACLIYDKRPLICRGYPVAGVFIAGDKKMTDKKGPIWEAIKKKSPTHCRLHAFCQWSSIEFSKGKLWLAKPFPISFVKGLDIGATIRFQRGKYSNLENTTIWRYATGIHNVDYLRKKSAEYKPYIGWINWGWF